MAWRQPFRSGLRELAEGLLKRAQAEREYGQVNNQIDMQQAQVAAQAWQNLGQIAGQTIQGMVPPDGSTEYPERVVGQAQGELTRAEEALAILVQRGAPEHIINGQRRLVAGLRATATGPLASAPGTYAATMQKGYVEQIPLSYRERGAGRLPQQILPSGLDQMAQGSAMAGTLTDQYQQAIEFATALRVRAGSYDYNDPASVQSAIGAMEVAARSGLPADLLAPIQAEVLTLQNEIRNNPLVAAIVSDADKLRVTNLAVAQGNVERQGVDLEAARVALAHAKDMNPLYYEDLRVRVGDAGMERYGVAMSTGIIATLTEDERKNLAGMLDLGSKEELAAWSESKIAEVAEASTAANRMTVLTRDIAIERHEAWVATNAIEYDNLVRSVGDARAARIIAAIGSGVVEGMNSTDRSAMARALKLPNSGAALNAWASNRMDEVTAEASARSRMAGTEADRAEVLADIERDRAAWARMDRPTEVAQMRVELQRAVAGLEGDRQANYASRASAVEDAMGSGVLVGLDEISRKAMARGLGLPNAGEALDAWAADVVDRNERSADLALEHDRLRNEDLQLSLKIGRQTIRLNDQTYRQNDQTYNRNVWVHARDQAMAVGTDRRAAIQEETELGTNIAMAVTNDDAEVLSFYLSALDRSSPLGIQMAAIMTDGSTEDVMRLRADLTAMRDGALARQALAAERVRIDDAFRRVNYDSAVLGLEQKRILTPLETLAMAEQFRLDHREAAIRLNSLEFTTATDAIRVAGEVARAMPPEFWDNPTGPVIDRLRALGLEPEYFRGISEHEEWLRGDGKRQQGMDMLNVLLKSPPANEFDLEVMQQGVIEAVELMDIRSPTARSAFISSAMSIWSEQDENLRLRYLQLMASSANAMDGGTDGTDLARVAERWSSLHTSLNQQLNQYINTEVSLSRCATVFTIPELGPRISSRKDASAEVEGQPGRKCGEVFAQYDLLRGRADNANIQQEYWVNQLSGAPTGVRTAGHLDPAMGARGSYESPFPPRGQPPTERAPVAPSNPGGAAPAPAGVTGGALAGGPTPQSSAAALVQPPAGSPVLPYHVATFNEIRKLFDEGADEAAQSLIEEMYATYPAGDVEAYLNALGLSRR